ncbi:MAG TPA: 3-deoxy-D-manno-octulosonic acid kinase [Pasteurellaceae bacterium]|nr:3-deoxy-D-manno-octulosonic acid kinase [Pasteurellaceae bacterium]
MIELQNKNRFFLFARQDYVLPDYEQFFEPDYWQKQGRIIGSAKGRGTTWFVQGQDLFGMNGALRHYYRGGILGKINKDLYRFNSLEETRSFAELRLLDWLHQVGLPVPKPIAAKVETGFGGYRADILLEKLENTQDLTALLQHTSLPGQSWWKIGKLIRHLHDLQICHTDLNAHNILLQRIDQQEKYWLLDFDKCGQKSGNSWKQENLQRLYRSFMKEIGRMHIQFTEQNWQALLEGYESGGD